MGALGFGTEYLVKLGFGKDEAGYAAFKKSLDNVKTSVQNVSASLKTSVSLVKAVSEAYTKPFAIVKQQVDEITSADYAFEHLARRFWMTEKNAKSLGTALQSLGYSSDDIRAIFWMSPNEYARFQTIRKEYESIYKGAEYERSLEYFKDIETQLNLIKIDFEGVKQNAIITLSRSDSFRQFSETLADIRKWLRENNVELGELIGKFANGSIKPFVQALNDITRVGKTASEIFDKLGVSADGFGEALSRINILAIAFKANPLIGSLLLLLQLFSKVEERAEKENAGYAETGEWNKGWFAKETSMTKEDRMKTYNNKKYMLQQAKAKASEINTTNNDRRTYNIDVTVENAEPQTIKDLINPNVWETSFGA